MQILLQNVYLTFRFFHRLAKSITLTDTEAHSEIQRKNSPSDAIPRDGRAVYLSPGPISNTHNDGE